MLTAKLFNSFFFFYIQYCLICREMNTIKSILLSCLCSFTPCIWDIIYGFLRIPFLDSRNPNISSTSCVTIRCFVSMCYLIVSGMWFFWEMCELGIAFPILCFSCLHLGSIECFVAGIGWSIRLLFCFCSKN